VALAGGVAHADRDDDEAVAAAHVSTNPLPYVETLKFVPSYTFSNDSTQYRAELQFEPVLPYRGVLIPGLEVWDMWSIARLQVTAENLQNANGTAGGFENLNLVDVAAHQFDTLAIGVGFGTVFPMATSSELGPAKWQLGPAAGFHYAPTTLISIAALAQSLWSVAGSSQVAHQSYVTLQPFIALHVDRLVIVSDAQMSFYWAGGSTTIPVGLGVGYAFSKHFVGTIKGTLTVAGQGDGTLKATVELAFLP
jgi:hypothetical protein